MNSSCQRVPTCVAHSVMAGGRRFLQCVLVLVFASGCTLSGRYQAPTEKAPDLWRVRYELVRDPSRAIEIVPGAHVVGDVILRVPVWRPTEARLAKPWRFVGGSFSDAVNVPVGTRFVMQQFALTQTWYVNGRYDGSSSQSPDGADNPVEWCLSDAQLPSVCVFWETPVRVRVIATPFVNGEFGVPEDTRGFPAPMPVLALASDASTPTLTDVYRVHAMGRDGIAVSVSTEGGGLVDSQRIQTLRFGRGVVEVHTIEGVSFSVHRDDGDATSVSRRPSKVRLVRVPGPAG